MLQCVNPISDDSDWVDPVTWDELWMPEDLPVPRFQPALAVVLKDGKPRYLSPTVDTTIHADGREWRNRGMRSVPLAKTWLPWDEVAGARLSLSVYAFPPSEGSQAARIAGAAGAAAASDALPSTTCEPLALNVRVEDALSVVGELMAESPSVLSDAFAHVVIPLPEESLPAEHLSAGSRLRVFLSDIQTFPAMLPSETEDEDEFWAWRRGECDIVLMEVNAGGSSEWLPDVYKALYAGSSV